MNDTTLDIGTVEVDPFKMPTTSLSTGDCLIYFLWFNNHLVHIGYTKKGLSGVYANARTIARLTDEVSFIEVPEKDLASRKADLIKKHNPLYKRVFGCLPDRITYQNKVYQSSSKTYWGSKTQLNKLSCKRTTTKEKDYYRSHEIPGVLVNVNDDIYIHTARWTTRALTPEEVKEEFGKVNLKPLI